ncbi:MAG TPA: SRPBCC family protein [Puia sp.]|nr:SRPBCC family protein [Puia sp.]
MIALYIILGIIALILIIAAIAGTAINYEQSILINAPLSRVWDNIKTLHAINQWNPWMDLDPNMKIQYGGTDGTPGAGFSWDSTVKNAGAGSQTILKVSDQSQLHTRIDFLRPFKNTAYADFNVAPDTGNTRVSWSLKGKMPYPMNIMKLTGAMQKNIGKDFTKGLNKLKTICES